MSAVRAFARRHPVLSYYALVFTISWGGILILVAPSGIPGEPEDVARLFPFTLAARFAGPSVAGVAMTGLVSGKAGLRELRARLVQWRVGGRWWAAALLTGPILVAAVLFGLSLYSTDFIPGLLTTEDKLGLVTFGLGWGLVGGGLLEELGWTGFAVPMLRQRYGALVTGLIVGLLWGTWHLLIAFWASRMGGVRPHDRSAVGKPFGVGRSQPHLPVEREGDLDRMVRMRAYDSAATPDPDPTPVPQIGAGLPIFQRGG